GSGRAYVLPAKAKRIRFCIEFDRAFAETSMLPPPKIPLLFSGRVLDPSFGGAEHELSKDELFALISAFLLGVKAPIAIEKDSVFPYYKILLQLSSTYFVECGELLDQGADLTAEVICHFVSLSLYNKSSDFFRSREEGLAIWIARAAQELFGAHRPSPEALWPYANRHAEAGGGEE
ncbi:MAG TPA: hypothetical protein VED87_07600, partial [Methylocystis sp.]|nr:hypothetical protein [Methylocystis sp.]